MSVKKIFNYDAMRESLREILTHEPMEFLELATRIGVSEITVRRFLLEDSKPKHMTAFLIAKYIKQCKKSGEL